jgi:hypothetical protein
VEVPATNGDLRWPPPERPAAAGREIVASVGALDFGGEFVTRPTSRPGGELDSSTETQIDTVTHDTRVGESPTTRRAPRHRTGTC